MADPILTILVANERCFGALYKAQIICLIIISESVFIDVNRWTYTFDIDTTRIKKKAELLY